jgi:hypothetical protein
VQDHRVGCARPGGFRQQRAQLAFDDNRILRVREADSIADTQDVPIDGKPGHSERMPQHHIRRFAADTRKLHQGVHCLRHRAVVALDEGVRHANE